MNFKKIKRFACVLAAAATLAAVPALSGCHISTDHPEAQITISFDEKEYVLNYKMYRNMYPQTVLHFIELADAGFYNDMIIHDYESSYWYSGGYKYDSETYLTDYQTGAMNSYVEENSKEREYYEDMFLGKKLTPSVYLDHVSDKFVDPLPTVIGEFSDANHTIDKGALNSSFGCLRMYYTTKKVTVIEDGKTKEIEKEVYLEKVGTPEPIIDDYSSHSATSIFNIQMSTSTAKDSDNCIFGVLQNTDKLTELKDYIADYVSEHALSTSFTSDVEAYVDNYDTIIESRKNSLTFTMTSMPIVIKSVKITKY